MISGGHPLPVVIRSTGDVERIGSFGTLLGSFATIKNAPACTTLAGGDSLFFFTDGITDVPPPHALSDEEVSRLFASAAHADNAEQTAEAVRAGLAEQLPVGQRHDDIALLVLKFLAGTSTA
jgi:serine phosphatase RsbU (regulator of sigma subunit)